MPELRAPRASRSQRCPRWSRRGVTALALLAAGCAQPPQTPFDRVQRFADAYVRLLPVGRVMEVAAAQDARWPLGAKADLVSDTQLACMRAGLSSSVVSGRQRQAARDYAQAHADTLDGDLRVLEAGAARLIGDAMLAGAGDPAPRLPTSATPEETQALAAFATEPRYAALRRATGLDALLGGGTERAAQRGRDLGHALVVKAMTDAFLSCHIPVKLLY
ncbi:MAG: hypothetical protein KBE90_09975 [Ottowia sp.]|jgi:hypothetical protein|nr:hypothetical protein [Ottowia sp.]MBP7456346.1 hypothetical protein [Ottowia sp.]MBP7457880.1 hypothetical protein [Ottowia sp.]MBP8861501.1 hypothetical protein [Ottowia sp.]MBP8927418.1 hypothetical protein [Ottowia sp.]